MAVNLESIPNQFGTALLDSNGKVIQATGDLEQRADICSAIYSILLDTAKCLQNEPLRRVVISYSDHSYHATIGKGQIYIAKIHST